MTIVAIVDPPGAFIEGMAIKPELQGTGLGRAEYEDWERKLPADVKFITLRAIPTSEGFWLRLGFSSLRIEGDPLMFAKVRSLLETEK